MTNDLPERKPILCLDFDGVIHEYSSGWKGARCIPDMPVSGALEFIVEALEHFQVCIYSSRSRYLGGKRAMKRWLWDRYAEIGDVSRRKWFLGPFGDAVPEDQEVPEIPKWWMKTILQGTHMEPWEHEVDDGIKRHILKKIKFPTRKPAAFLQIDDRAITFRGVWPSIKDLLQFKPWNKK